MLIGNSSPPSLSAEGYLLSEKNWAFELGLAASISQEVLKVLGKCAWGL